MAMTVDIVLCVDNTLSVQCDGGTVCQMFMKVFQTLLEKYSNVRICVIKLRSTSARWLTVTDGFTDVIDTLKGTLTSDEPADICPNEEKPIGEHVIHFLSLV